jgi:hypothetical protein
LDKARGGSENLEVGQERRKYKCLYPRPQAEVEDNVHHRAHQRSARHEEIIGRTHQCENTKEGVSDSNGTISRAGSRIPGTGKGIQDTYSIDPGRVRIIYQ